MNHTDKEPLINHIGVLVFHLLVVVTNVVSVLFSVSWVWYICAQINQTRKIKRRFEREHGEVTTIRELESKIKKYYLYLVIMVIEAFHVALRLIIYIIFTVLDFLEIDAHCETIDEYRAYYFIESLMPYQFIWIGLSHSLALALMISLIVTLLFLRETYSYYEKRFRWVKIWIIIGIIQFLLVWSLLSIPWVALLGSTIFTVFAVIDFLMLYKASKRLLSVLNMRLFDLRYEHQKYWSFRKSLLKFKWFGSFLLSLMVYLFGIIFAHLAIWLSISPCYFDKYFNIGVHLNTTEVQIVADVASVIWLLDYLAILQFDLALVGGNIAYLIYTRVSMRNVNAETRQLLRDYTDSVSDRQRGDSP